MRPFARLGFVLVFAVLLPAVSARADDASEARLHNQMAEDLYGQRRFEEAIQHFLASNRLVPNAAVALNIARIYGVMERWVESYNWYETYLREFELADEQRTRGVAARDALLPRVAVVMVETSPVGAVLFVDRAALGSVGTSPRQVAVTAGPHSILARLDGHHEQEARLAATLGAVTSTTLTLEAILGAVRVESDPPGASVRLSDREEPLGTTPLEVSLAVGTHRLALSHPGYSEVVRDVTIVEGQSASVTASLARLASNVALLSVATPVGAEILVDGESIGVAPLSIDTLEARSHRLELHQEGREPYVGEVVLEAGGATRVSAILEDPSAVHFEDLRFAGYTIGGVAVLAGLGLGVGALILRDAFFANPNPTRADLDLVGNMNLAADVLWISGLVILGATLIADLVIGPRPHSRADSVVDR